MLYQRVVVSFSVTSVSLFLTFQYLFLTFGPVDLFEFFPIDLEILVFLGTQYHAFFDTPQSGGSVSSLIAKIQRPTNVIRVVV